MGAACAPCATAKAKCIRSNDSPGAKCDSSTDVSIVESVGTSVSHNHQQLFRDASSDPLLCPSRTAQIEERLNGLVNLLKASGDLANTQAGPSSQGGITDERARRGISDTPSYSSPSSSIPPSSNPWAIDPTYNSSTPKSCICHPESEEAPPPPDTDENLLNFYRETHQPVHPFVVIPPNVSAATLKSRRPFLMAAVRMVSSFRNLRSMRAQMYHLMKYISDHMLIRSEKSLDLLLGIIVILGYQQYHCCLHGQLNNLIALAVTLVGDIGINRPPGLNERLLLMVVRPPEPMGRTNEERRAFLGAWYWASVISMNFGKVQSMRYNNYLQESLQYLEREMEYESDIYLINLVRIQRLTERIAEFNYKDKAVGEIYPVPTAPASAYVSAFQSELNHLTNNMPEHLKQDKIFRVFLDSARLRLYEPPVVDKDLINSLSESFASVSLDPSSPLDKIYQSSAAITSWFDNWLSVPVSSYYLQTTAVGSHLVWALTMLGRWAKLATPRAMYGQIPIQDPSTQHPNMGLYNPDLESSQCESGVSGMTGVTAGKQPMRPGQPLHHDPRYSGHFEGSDPDLAAAVAVLRSQLQAQPGLMVNVPEILSAICNRFDQANATYQWCSTDSDRLHKNLWVMTALKVRITRAKLEKWAELVSTGGEGMHLEGKAERDAREMNMSEWYGGPFPSQAAGSALDELESLDASSMGQSEDPWDAVQASFAGSNSPWTNDLLTDLDPSIWFDGYFDFGEVIMNSMGNVEQ
ncbi:Transcription factor himD [Cladobotryum mycophilum]|uniref:Transcription factor himD n=1 Tax=Cladobotryum mycophilum TaxID=491253 RepID=A0ABR0SKI0_9HYPO